MSGLITDPGMCNMIACLAFLLAAFPILYIIEALGRDALQSLPSEPEPWPERQTPTDLAAAYLDHDECPTCERHFYWLADPRWVWATQRLEEIKVDVRDWMPAEVSA